MKNIQLRYTFYAGAVGKSKKLYECVSRTLKGAFQALRKAGYIHYTSDARLMFGLHIQPVDDE